jgi:hypothetical protein
LRLVGFLLLLDLFKEFLLGLGVFFFFLFGGFFVGLVLFLDFLFGFLVNAFDLFFSSLIDLALLVSSISVD